MKDDKIRCPECQNVVKESKLKVSNAHRYYCKTCNKIYVLYENDMLQRLRVE